MGEPTLVQKVLDAAAVLEELKQNPQTNQESYTPESLRFIVSMFRGA